MRVLIVYGSTHGQTAQIAERVAARMRGLGADVVVSGDPDHTSASGFDAIVVGGRVHGSHYPRPITRFIRRNLSALGSQPTAFFSVSLLQFARDADQRDATLALPRRATLQLGWTPDRTEVFGGALLWKRQYTFLAPLFKRMWRRTLERPIDPRAPEQIFTDWNQVDGFADSFLELARVHTRSAGPDGASTSDSAAPATALASR